MKLCCCFSHIFYPLKFVGNYWKSACDKRYQRRFYLFIFKHWSKAIESSMSKFFFSCVYQMNPLELNFFSIWWCNQSNRYAFNMANINRLRIYLIFLFFQKSNNVMKRAKNRNFRFKTSCILFAGFNDRIFIGWTVLWLTQSESHYSASQVIIFNRILFQDAKQLRN